MKKGIIIALIVGVLIFLFISIKKIYDRIAIDVLFKKINLSTIKLPALLIGGGFFRLEFFVRIFNYNKLQIPVKDVFIKIFYKGKLIGQSSEIQQEEIRIIPNSFSESIVVVDVYVKPELINLLTDLISSEDPELEYEASYKIYGIRIKTREKVGEVTEEN